MGSNFQILSYTRDLCAQIICNRNYLQLLETLYNFFPSVDSNMRYIKSKYIYNFICERFYSTVDAAYCGHSAEALVRIIKRLY